MENITFTGALLDERLDEEKAKDYLHEELASGDEAYQWEERPMKDRYFYPYDQDGSLSCVMGGIVIPGEHFAKKEGKAVQQSRKDGYIRRLNYPAGGMHMYDAFNIAIKGVCGEALVKSQGLSETPMNAQYPVTNEILKERSENAFEAWVAIGNFRDIDTLASIAKHTPVMVYWFFIGIEWWQEKPQIYQPALGLRDSATLHHQVCIVDAVLINGKKYLVGQDTAGVGSGLGKDKNLRLISEEMVSKRTYLAGYAIDKPTVITPPEKPKFTFTRHLSVGMTGDDVRALQEILKYEGCITLETTTKLFGGITLAGVKKLQQKHFDAILKPAGLLRPTGYVGTNTIKYLNATYGNQS